MDAGNEATPIVYINCVNSLQYSFASHLTMEFRRKGISSFTNSKGTLDVIERASASVVVFSDNCLSSNLFLDKLASVLRCRRLNGLVLVPVFYCISPSDLVILKHESSYSANQIRKWSSALREMSGLPGHQFREEYSECNFVEEVVKYVHEKLFPTEQIGINSRMLEIEQLLCKQPWGVRRIGIWGMPGIGKTTLAEAFFDQISGGYEASCFIKHFDKAFNKKGLHCLLEEHFGKILKELPPVCSSFTRPSLPRDKLNKKRTLVVLDDVHNPLVAESFLEGFHWFGPGSLIIITSRDKQVFHLCQINHVYEVKSLKMNEALQLFSQCAFLNNMREQNLLKLSMEVIDYANGNPLALSFYARELKGKKQSEMETTFLKLKLRAPYKIHDLFRSSYETLDDKEKNIFLDIACFFNGENVDYVMRLLEVCGFFPHIGIDVLVDKCLVTIFEDRVKMHRIIQDFGREIINGETVQIERRRRLWEPWTIKFLLEDEANEDLKATYTRAMGTEDIEGIYLDASKLLFDVKSNAFEYMLNLRFLKIYCSSYENHCGLHLPKGLESLPYELRLLHWQNYPLHTLPHNFNPCHLVELNLSYSQLQKLWPEGTKNLDMLKIVRLCHSQQLTEIDDILKAQNIELIDLQGCPNLLSFPATGQLQHLRVVNLSGCKEIKSFPEVSPNIEELHLQGTSIRELPICIVSLFKEAKLNRELSNLLTEFSGVSNALNNDELTSLTKVVSSTQNLGKLVCLNMKDCVHLRSLPHMVDFESLKILNLSGCPQLDDIQGFPRNLKELYLVGTAMKELPQLPQSLELLNAHGCVSLISFPTVIERLPRYYTFSNCSALSAKVVNEFVNNALTNVARLAREKQELNKSLAFSFAVPSPECKTFTVHLQPGSSVMIQLGSSWRNKLGFAIFVEVALLEDYHGASGFGIAINCVCRWKDKEYVSHRLEKTYHCWTLGKGVSKDHIFVFCDLNMHLSICEGNDPTILADLVVFEFFTVNKHNKLLDESCKVTKCGVHMITAADEDTSSNMTQLFSSSDYLQEIFDNQLVLRAIYDDLDVNAANLFHYISCLFNDEEANFFAPLIASIGLEISSRLKVLASKSLIHISPYGIIVRYGLLQKLGRELFYNKERIHQSYKMHSSMCIKLENLVDQINDIVPRIEDARPGSSSGIQTLCLLHKSLAKAKQLLQYCRESSKLYMAVTGDAILTRGSRAKTSLEQCLDDIRSMVPTTVLATKITQIVQDLRSTVLTLESSEEEAGKAIRDLMQRSTSSSVSLDETREFHIAASKLQLLTPQAVVIERISLISILEKLAEDEGNKKPVLKYLLCLLENHKKNFCEEHIETSFSDHQCINGSLHANATESECSKEHSTTHPEEFKCQLSRNLMYDPVIISSGHTFERMWIQKWFDEGNVFCPKSRRRLDDFTLEPNEAIKNQISKWCAKNGRDVQDSSHSEIEKDPLCGLTTLPWDAQIKVIEDVKSRFGHSTRAFQSMSPSKFLEPLITYLKNALERNGTAGDVIKGGLDLLLAFLNGNRKAIESLEAEVFKMFSVFLESEVVAEEALNILEVVSSHQYGLSKITSSGSLSSLLKIAESQAVHLQEQAMITLKNLSSSAEICLEMVSLDFIQKLTSFLQRNIFCKQSIIILRNLCNTEKGRVCITETPDCLASIADLLESNVPEEQENAITIILQLCVQKIEYCELVLAQVSDIYSSLLLISNNGTEEAKVGASELLRALKEVDVDRREEEITASTTPQVVTSVTRQEPIIPALRSARYGFSFPSLKKKR